MKMKIESLTINSLSSTPPEIQKAQVKQTQKRLRLKERIDRSKEEITSLQQELQNLGFQLETDGIFGPVTKEALEKCNIGINQAKPTDITRALIALQERLTFTDHPPVKFTAENTKRTLWPVKTNSGQTAILYQTTSASHIITPDVKNGKISISTPKGNPQINEKIPFTELAKNSFHHETAVLIAELTNSTILPDINKRARVVTETEDGLDYFTNGKDQFHIQLQGSIFTIQPQKNHPELEKFATKIALEELFQDPQQDIEINNGDFHYSISQELAALIRERAIALLPTLESENGKANFLKEDNILHYIKNGHYFKFQAVDHTIIATNGKNKHQISRAALKPNQEHKTDLVEGRGLSLNPQLIDLLLKLKA